MASSIRDHEKVNSSLKEDRLITYQRIKMGIAVAVPDGLLVPVLDDPDRKGLKQINEEVRELAEKAPRPAKGGALLQLRA